jgi:hypothetical protein
MSLKILNLFILNLPVVKHNYSLILGHCLNFQHTGKTEKGKP